MFDTGYETIAEFRYGFRLVRDEKWGNREVVATNPGWTRMSKITGEGIGTTQYVFKGGEDARVFHVTDDTVTLYVTDFWDLCDPTNRDIPGSVVYDETDDSD